MTDWPELRPMSEAPTDGTRFLGLTERGDWTIAAWDHDTRSRYRGWVTIDLFGRAWLFGFLGWVSLPPAPELPDEADEDADVLTLTEQDPYDLWRANRDARAMEAFDVA